MLTVNRKSHYPIETLRSDEGRHYCDYTGTQYPTGDPKSENNGMVNGGTEEWRNNGTAEKPPES